MHDYQTCEAKRLKRLIDEGGDPLGDIEDERAAPTVAELIERFVAEHIVRKRPSTSSAYRRMLDLHIRPHFGAHLKVADVRFEHVDALHRLHGHALRPKTIWPPRRGIRDRSAKGYLRKQFEAAWASYCSGGTPAHPRNVRYLHPSGTTNS